MWGGGFVNRIKEARKRAGMKQADLCALLGVSQGALSGWENGRFDPGASVWLRLAQILGVSLEYLMGGEAPEGAAPASAPRVAFRVELKRLREAAGLSQQKFADLFGVSQSAVGLWEGGKREPPFRVLCQMADFFAVSTDQLLGHAPADAAAGGLDGDERQILADFRALDARGRAVVLDVLRGQLRFCPPCADSIERADGV